MNASSSRPQRRRKPLLLSLKVRPLKFTIMQREYTCITTTGKWNFYADNDFEAIRLSLFYCWRDGDNFVRVERRQGAEHYTLRISHIDHNTHETFTL